MGSTRDTVGVNIDVLTHIPPEDLSKRCTHGRYGRSMKNKNMISEKALTAGVKESEVATVARTRSLIISLKHPTKSPLVGEGLGRDTSTSESVMSLTCGHLWRILNMKKIGQIWHDEMR